MSYQYGQGVSPVFRGSLDTRTITWLVAILLFMGIVGYGLGWGAMRYKDPINDPYHSWPFWRHAIAMGAPVFLACIMLIFLVDISSHNRTGFFTSLVFWLIILVAGYMIFFMVWEIIVWSRCNNLTGPTPNYPECINRFYPVHTGPDVSFLLMFFGNVTSFIAAAICFWFHSRLQAAASSDWVQGARAMGQGGTPMMQMDDSSQGYTQSQIGTHMFGKDKHHSQHHSDPSYYSNVGAPYAAEGSAFV
jgi:vacuolar-type H+-ATPase subunit I/STV1